MPATRTEIAAVLASDDWTEGEKFAIQWQFGLLGNFNTALITTIKLADEMNLMRLKLGFPMEVAAFLAWSQGDLAERLRKAGLEI